MTKQVMSENILYCTRTVRIFAKMARATMTTLEAPDRCRMHGQVFDISTVLYSNCTIKQFGNIAADGGCQVETSRCAVGVETSHRYNKIRINHRKLLQMEETRPPLLARFKFLGLAVFRVPLSPFHLRSKSSNLDVSFTTIKSRFSKTRRPV